MPPPVHTSPSTTQEPVKWSRRARLLAIAFAAPLVVHVLGSLFWSPLLLLVAFLTYPLMVMITAVLLLSLHVVYSRLRAGPTAQLCTALPLGCIAGVLVTLILNPASFGSGLTAQYAALGALAATTSWLLYNWGPFKLAESR